MSIVTFPNIFFACMLFLRLPRIFFSLPYQITLKFDISRNKFPFTLNNSFLFCQQSRVKGKKEMFSLCKSFNSFFILSCLLSQLLAVAYMSLFLLMLCCHIQKQYLWEEKKVVDKNFKFCSRVVARYVFA